MSDAGMPRFTVTSSAGSRDGKRFGVWDKRDRRIASWHRTFQAAQTAAKKMNRKESP